MIRATALALSLLACGDVTADLVTGGGGSSGSGAGAGSAAAGAAMGGSGGGGSAPGGSTAGGSAGASQSGAGGAGIGASAGSAGSASGGASGGAGCNSSADCTSGEALYCHPEQRRCVECVTDGHCEEAAERCSAALGECAVPCAGNEDCLSDDPLCDLVIGFCVECLSDADCGSGQCRSSECR